jgi:hypothetical protein
MTNHYLVNDLSMCGQFNDPVGFRDAIDRVMMIRGEILKYGMSLYCHRRLTQALVFPDIPMPQAVQHLSLNKRRALMQWLTAHGPHWEDDQVHSSDEWYDVNDNVVTDTGLAEAAACRTRGIKREVVSFEPSGWLHTPIPVRWEALPHDQPILVPNHWRIETVRESLDAHATSVIESWTTLEDFARKAYSRLNFGDDAFHPLDGHPFVPGASERIQVLLGILDRFKGCFDIQGNRTPAGDQLYTLYFTGGKALFTDSSDAEKAEFHNELHFPHPEGTGYLFCTWHGKVKTPQIRIHFTYPIVHKSPLYVMYVGPKITKK